MTDDSTRVQVAFHAVDQEVRSWRRAHPDATLTEIERQLDTRLHAVRAALLADAPDEHQPEPRGDGLRNTRRVLGVVKSNLAAKPPARWCHQPVDGPLRWLPDPSPVTIDECFFAQPSAGSKSRDAEEWLTERLAGGSRPSTTVDSAAKAAGISRAALKRARAALNVKARKEPSGEWVLSLPPRLTEVRSAGVHLDPDQPVEAVHNDAGRRRSP